MTDLEISIALAKAIGWDESLFRELRGELYIVQRYLGICLDEGMPKDVGKLFDYRDPVVAFMVAEKFDCFPFWTPDREGQPQYSRGHYADTAAKAIALAVIGRKA